MVHVLKDSVDHDLKISLLLHGDHKELKLEFLDIPGNSGILFYFLQDNWMENSRTFLGHRTKKQ